MLQNGNVLWSQITAKPLELGSIADKLHETFLAKGSEFGLLIPLGASTTDAFNLFGIFCQRFPHFFHQIVVVVVVFVIVVHSVLVEFRCSAGTSRRREQQPGIINVKFFEILARP